MAGLGSKVIALVKDSNIGNIVKQSFVWFLATLLTNFLAMLVVLLALYGHPDLALSGPPDLNKHILVRTNEYFFASGAAAMVAIGLAAGAVTDLLIKSNGGKVSIALALAGFVAMVLAAVFYGEMLLGHSTTFQNAKEASYWMIGAGLVYGVAVQIANVRSENE